MDEGRFQVPQSTASNPGELKRGGRTSVVIADSGTSASVVVFPSSVNVAPGARFRYGDGLWMVTGERRDSGIFVARPIGH
jgi:hypothetical protein